MVYPVKRKLSCKVCERNRVYYYCSKDTAHYYVCKDCGLIFQDPLPGSGEMLDYVNTQYKSGEYHNYISAKNLKYTHFRDRLAQFRAHFPKGRLLDVGCSCGYFLDIALENGYDAFGIEFSDTAIAAAEPGTRERITRGTVNDLRVHCPGSFDLVTAFDIIEHVENPIDFLGHIKHMLKQSGGLIISTPDTGHMLRYVLGSRWPMLQPMQHTALFSEQSLRIALEKAGYVDIQVTTAYKTVTIDYLFEQIKSYNPFLHGAYRVLKKLIPENIRMKPRKVNIGELLVIARNNN